VLAESITVGARLGPYEVIGPLGAGGMGEVWKARDTRLDRIVAIKVLPKELAGNAQLRLRFEREARTISQLNHAHICTLFDVGDGYLVMELLEGETLADRIARGPLPLLEVLRYGVEIAEALDKAHRAGVIHRDLKPGNVMITKSGAKLLDFGLAKSSVLEISTDGATQQKALTQEGTILGTFQYMSPEQLEGGEADARGDIFALGALLYEMATGHRAFEGKTRTSLIAAIVKEHPRPIAELQPLTPPALQHVVDNCLAKDADDRTQSAHDVAAELQWISHAGSQAGVAAPITSARIRNRRLVAAAAVGGWTIAVAAVVVAVSLQTRLGAASRVTQAEISASVAGVSDEPLAVSPDGRRIAVTVDDGAVPQLWIRELSSGEGHVLAGTEGASYPFWAPDGHAIGFFAGGKLKTVTAESGAIQIICDAPYGRGGTWSQLGVIVFAPNITTPLVKVSENGGTPVAVTKLQRPQGDTHRNPMFLPDGKHFLYCVGSVRATGLSSSLRAGSVDGGFDRKVLDYASAAAFVNGWLLTVRDRNLVAQELDPDAMSVKGKPVVIAQNIDWYQPRFTGSFSVGASTLVYQHARQPRLQLLRFDPTDTKPVAVGGSLYLTSPAISPDGGRVIVNRFDPTTNSADVWMVDLGGAPPARLTFDGHGTMEDSGVFSPDGQRVALSSPGAGGTSQIWIQPAGGGSHEELAGIEAFVYLCDWSRDGKTLLISPQRQKTGQDIEVLHLDGDRKPVPLVHGDANEAEARFSPNQKWIAYMSDGAGKPEVFVTNYPTATAKWQVSSGGGRDPFWSADGKQLYYLADDHVMAAAVREGESFSAGPAQPVESLADHITDFAVAHNGRVVALRELDSGKRPITVVVNWQELLKPR
jgi:Tol biopolymer transport system component